MNLSDSDIGTQGMTNIAAALPGMPALAELKMCHCGIEEVGAQTLVRLFPMCWALWLCSSEVTH